MAKRKYTYDSDCEGLAAHFLAGERISETDLWDLAEHIQIAVEEWLAVRSLTSPAASAYDHLPADCEPSNDSICNDASPVGDGGTVIEGEETGL